MIKLHSQVTNIAIFFSLWWFEIESIHLSWCWWWWCFYGSALRSNLVHPNDLRNLHFLPLANTYGEGVLICSPWRVA